MAEPQAVARIEVRLTYGHPLLPAALQFLAAAPKLLPLAQHPHRLQELTPCLLQQLHRLPQQTLLLGQYHAALD